MCVVLFKRLEAQEECGTGRNRHADDGLYRCPLAAGRLRRLVALGNEQTVFACAVTLVLSRLTEKNLMTTDPTTNGGAPAGEEAAHLSDQDATLIARYEGAPELAAFVAALGMQRPVSSHQAARLLKHVVKETMSATIALIEGQMRTDHWDKDLCEGETLAILAERAAAYLESPAGVQLFNLFIKTFAKTTGEMFD